MRVPNEVREHVFEQLATFADPQLEATFRGRFCYIDHAGSPLCRLGYRGEKDDWDFAIFRYSTGRYGDLLFAPDHGTVIECISVAMHAYNLMG
jgi:hypothetical protein